MPEWARKSGREWEELRTLAHDLTDENREAIRFWRECHGSGRHPDDEVYQWYAGLIYQAMTETDKVRADRQYQYSRGLTDTILQLLVRQRR